MSELDIDFEWNEYTGGIIRYERGRLSLINIWFDKVTLVMDAENEDQIIIRKMDGDNRAAIEVNPLSGEAQEEEKQS